MQLFYNSSLESNIDSFFFSTEESKHICKVLRKKEGDFLHITNGKGFLFKAELLVADPRKCHAQIIEKTESKPRPYRLHMVVAPTKMNDRFEWFLEKATEIGVDEITPILCDRSERKVIKLERMQRVVQSAMKQSLQTFLPTLHPLTPFNTFIEKDIINSHSYIAHCDDGQKTGLKHIIKPNTDSTILIGPEGDFSTDEIKKAIKKGYQPISLGDTRLRTETAAIVACTTAAVANT